MADEEAQENLAKVVSQFLRSSCRRRDTEMMHINFTELLRGLSYSVRHPINSMKCRKIPVYTGSSAELYIEPMLSCTGDFDIMYHYNNELAVPSGQPFPTHLPEEYGNRVRVFEVIDSDLPGYVHLVLSYVLSRKVGFQNAYVIDYIRSSKTFLNHSLYANDEDSSKFARHGPAFRHSTHEAFFSVATDMVPCIRCLNWPPQAIDWQTRKRGFGWPNPALLDAIVKAGCDVVGVAHPVSKAHEWMRNHQWRLSFSRAEILLLNSWTLEQQIVYHMLRTLLKTERLTETSDTRGADSLCNYHIKTLMMWATEINPQNVWAEGPKLVSTCVKVVHFLGEWLTKWNGQHYFINTVHFADYIDTSSIHTVLAIAQTTTDSSLSIWFVDNYIKKCAELCPDNVLLLFCGRQLTTISLHNAVDTILKWRDHIAGTAQIKQTIASLLNSRLLCIKSVSDLCLIMPTILSQWTGSMMTDITIFKYLQFLRASLEPMPHFVLETMESAGKESISSLNFLNNFAAFSRHVQSCICSQKHLLPFSTGPMSSRNDSVSTVKKATTLLKLIAVEQRDCTTSELIMIALSKCYLALALRCRDSHYDSIYCLANVYLSVLYYLTGRFQRAIDHCMLVTKSQGHSQCKSSVVQGEILSKIADDIDIVLGLVALYQHLRTATTIYHRRDMRVCTPEIFASYFLIKYLLVAKCRLAPIALIKPIIQATKIGVSEQLETLRNRLLGCEALFVSDLMLCKISHSPSQSGTKSSTFSVHSCSENEVAKVLEDFSIEDLLKCGRRPTFYRTLGKTNIGSFLALSLYRCGLYEQCMELCQRNIHELDTVKPIPRLSATYYEFIQLMDDDIVSLCGLAVLLNKPEWRPKLDVTVTVGQPILSLYLLTASQVRGLRDQQTILITMIGVLDKLVSAQRATSTASFVDHLMLKLTRQQAMALTA